jgi:hypothetical protein
VTKSRGVLGQITFELFLLIVVATFAVMSLSYRFDAKIMPLAVSIVAAGLIMLQLVLDMARGPGKSDQPSDNDLQDRGWWRPLLVFLYLAGFVLLLIAVGYLTAVPVAAFLLMRFLGGVAWKTAAAVSAGLWLFVYVTFELILEAGL